MTPDTSHDDKVAAWRQAMLQKLDATRTRWAAQAETEAARPPQVRRQPVGHRRFRAPGPADAAQQAAQAEAARRLAQAREAWLLSMARATKEIAAMMTPPPGATDR